MDKNKQVIIVGGGIAGLTVALFLKKIGINAGVFEAYPYRKDIGGGLQIAPNGMNVIKTLGLGNKVIKNGVLGLAKCFQNSKGKVLTHFESEALTKYGEDAVNIARSTFHQILVDETEREGIEIHYEKRLKEITCTDNGKVTAHFEDGSASTGDFLIGADGIHSRTRQFVCPNGPTPKYTGLLNVGGFAPLSATHINKPTEETTTYFTFGRKGFFGYNLCNKGEGEEVMWWSNIPLQKEMTKEALRRVTAEELRRELMQIHKGWHDPIETIIRQTPDIFAGNIYDVESLPKWHHRRVLLIGDAAHAMSPHAGQGASIAMEDALYLAKLIKEKTGSIEDIFQLFKTERRDRAEKVVKQARRNGSNKQEIGPFVSWMRDRFLAVMLPVFDKKGQDWIYRYKISWNGD